MTFRQAVTATPSVAAHHRPGLQALRKEHSKLIQITGAMQLDGSIDLDKALLRSKPNEPRWDYGVGVAIRHGSVRVVWIEFHPASSSHVKSVLDKLEWLHAWLKHDAPALNQLQRRFVWVASGSVAIPASSPQRRRIAASGLAFRAKRLNLADFVH